MIYRSKLDVWLAAVALAAAAVIVAWGLLPLLARQAWGHAAVVAGMMVLLAALMYPLHYALVDGELVVRSGVQRWRVPLADIISVRPVVNFVASPALSLDRLEILYVENGLEQSILISPEHQDEFLLDLVRRERELRPFGFGLVRRRMKSQRGDNTVPRLKPGLFPAALRSRIGT